MCMEVTLLTQKGQTSAITRHKITTISDSCSVCQSHSSVSVQHIHDQPKNAIITCLFALRHFCSMTTYNPDMTGIILDQTVYVQTTSTKHCTK